jgi:hypothetical protein
MRGSGKPLLEVENGAGAEDGKVGLVAVVVVQPVIAVVFEARQITHARDIDAVRQRMWV